MDAQTVLDHVIFQLTPTRTRYELFVVARGVTERMTSGLIKPFLLHLQAAEEQLAKGGYSIKLEPPAHSKAPWFTKGAVDRFVRFVSSPEVIERGNTIEVELVQLEETIRMQTLTSSRVEDPLLDQSSSICLLGEKSLSPSGKPRLKKMRQGSVENDSGVSTNSKKQLLRALEARRMVLQKEQGMAFARAAAAGFELVPLLQLIMFAECFGAARLREACCSFVALCKKGQITGFCIGDLYLIDQDISWAFSNSACVRILKYMEKSVPLKEKSDENNTVLSKTVADSSVQRDQKLFDGGIGSENPSIKINFEQQLPLSHANLNPSSQFFDWNSAAVYQGWPAMYTDRNGPCSTFNGYHYGYSPGSQQSFTTLSDMSPSATGLFCYSTGVRNQQPFEMQANCQTSSPKDMNAFPSLKKLQIGHRSKKKSRMAAQDVKSDESFTHGYEKDSSSDMTDSSLERSDSSKVASVVLQDDYASRVLVKDGLKQGLSTTAGFRKNRCKVAEAESRFTGRTGSSEFSDRLTETLVPNFRGDALLSLEQKNDTSRPDGRFALHQTYDATSNVQKSLREISDNSLILFEQCGEDSVGSRSKKRLDFQEPETHRKQKLAGEIKLIDDSFFACSPPVTRDHRIKPAIESELQGNQIYDKMSKLALRVNSVVPTRRHEPDDLLMLPRQRNRDSSRNSSDVLNIDAELRGSAERVSLLKSQKTLMGSEPSQERVKNFLNQYNEKRDAKLRGNASSSKTAERGGKLKAIKEDLDKRKLDLAKATRPERARLQTEAQLRADKLRMYKADLLKSKKEKEEEERRRIEELKAQRQLRIAARSNHVGRSKASSSNPRGQMNLQLSTSKPSPAASRLSALQKSRTSLRDSQGSTSSRQMPQHVREHASSSSPKGAVRQQLRSSTPSVSRQTGKASTGSQSSSKAEALQSPQRTTSPSIKTNRVFSAVFNKTMQMGRPSSMGKKENSTIVSRKQGFLPGSHSGLPLDRSKKRLPSKEMLKSVDETKQEVRTFLKKGSGAGASSRSVQKMKPASPHTATTKDKRPLFTSGTQASRLDSKQSNKLKISGGDTRVATSGPTILKSKSSMSTPSAVNSGSTRVLSKSKLEVDSTKLEAGQANVHLDSKPSATMYWGAEGTAMQSNSAPWPRGCSALEKNHLNSERATLQGALGDSAMSRLMLFDTSCTVNGDPNIHSTEVQGSNLMSSGNFSKPQSTSAANSPQTLCNQQSNGLKKLSSLGHMSMPITGSTVLEGKRVSGKSPLISSRGTTLFQAFP